MNLTDLTPEQIQGLLGLLEQKDAEGQRTGARKFLHDLRDPQNPKARLNRPNFFWSADPDPNAKPYVHQEYPKLMFRLEGDHVVESMVFNAASKAALGPQWLDAPPLVAPTTNEEAIAAELASLSEDDRQLVFEAQREARLKVLQTKLSGLSDAALSRVTGEPVAKRGPGRPRKAESGNGA